MIALLSWRVWASIGLALALIGTHWKAYHSGAQSVKAEWAIETARLTSEALAASEANRAKEKTLTESVTNVKAKYAKQVKINSSLSASLDSSLRDFQAANNSPAGAASKGTTGTNGTGGLERELLGNCAASLAGLAKEADRLENKVVGLQGYVQSVGLDK